MSTYQETVLAGILPNRRDVLLLAQQHLEDEHFTDETHRKIWQLLGRYYDVAGDVLPLKTLSDLLTRQGVDDAKSLLYEQTYAALIEKSVADHEVRYALDGLKDQRSKYRTGVAITTAYEILEREVTLQDKVLKGHEDARNFVYSEFAQIDRLNHADSAPEGDARLEADRILQQYADRKSGKTTGGIRSGIEVIDKATGGFAPGELILLAAYTGQGKTQVYTQAAWHAAVVQGKNVFVGTSETVRDQVWRRMIARHTRLPQFGKPGGINSKHIREGTLTEEDEKIFQAALMDLKTNPTYGRIHIAQVPRGATLGFLEARMKRQGEMWEIQWAGFDYLPLLKADRQLKDRQQELNDLCKDAKIMAVSFYNGKGIPFISPWQMSQSAFKIAKSVGGYELANLADTSEAEKSSDQIWSILYNKESPKEAILQGLKLRDDDTPAPATVKVDYRNSFIGMEESALGSDDGDDDGDFLDMLGNN